MLNCIINFQNRQLAVFTPDDFPGCDAINIGGDERCEVKLDKTLSPAPVLFSIARVENDFVAVPGGTEVLELDGKEVTSARILPGMILRCGDFSLVFSGDLADSGKVLLWRAGRSKAKYIALGFGANLIGSGAECRGHIDGADIPPLLCRCWVSRDGVSIEPMNSQFPIKLMGRTLAGVTDITEGAVFDLAKGIQATVIDRIMLDRALKSGNPFYPEIGVWQRAVLAAMLFFAFSVLCYKVLEQNESSGKAYRTINALPSYTKEANEAEYLKKLEALWNPMLKEGRYYAVQMDVELLLENKNLPEGVKKALKTAQASLDAESRGMRIVRFYNSKLDIYAPAVMAKKYENIEIQSPRWNKSVQNNLAYWRSAETRLKEAAAKRRETGMEENSHFLPLCDNLLERIGRILDFYGKHEKMAENIAAGDFSGALQIAGEKEFQEMMKLYSQRSKFMESLSAAGALCSLVNEIKAPGFTPDKLPETAGRVKKLQDTMKSEATLGSAFPREITERYLDMLNRFVSGMESASQADRAYQSSGSGKNLLAGRKIFWQLSVSPLFENNEYRKKMDKFYTESAMKFIRDKSKSLEERGLLLENELSVVFENSKLRSTLEPIQEELEKESDAVCEKLYSQWLHAESASEKKALAEKILRNSLPGSSYREWAQSKE